MEIKQHPELTKKYPAVDGIAKNVEQNAIRTDILTILELDDKSFNEWHAKRKEATLRLLHDYELFTTIPDLRYASEQQQFDMTATTHVGYHVDTLRRGLEFLKVIKSIRDESRNPIEVDIFKKIQTED